MLDRLESRRLLAVTLDNGIINIAGSDDLDHVRVYLAEDKSQLAVKHNNMESTFALADVTGIRFDGRGGNDIAELTRAFGDFFIPATMHGGDGDDILMGVYSADFRAYGGEGDDWLEFYGCKRCTLYGDGGNDRVNAFGRGDHLLIGGDGHDSMHSAAGRDTLDAGAGNDRAWGSGLVIGGVGNDTLCGATVHGGAGHDYIKGTIGDDMLFGQAGNDVIDGGDGNDLLCGGIGSDLLRGGAGDDDLDGGADDDTVVGGAGNDDLFGLDELQGLADNTRFDSGLNGLTVVL